jgi:4-hydroxysphinganine ceramide fatty acyl 2-hydroxylase
MPGRTLPTILSSDVESRNSRKSCYVTLGTKVYDVTEFLDDHPGGDDLVLQYGGKDITEIMEDFSSHEHSESAYEVLEEYLIGFVAKEKVIDAVVDSDKPDTIVPLPPSATGMQELKMRGAAAGVTDKPVYANTGMSSAEDLSRETDYDADYKVHHFLDLNKPLFMQVWNGGFSKKFYLEQVHRPRHYKGGDSAPLFGNFLEPLSKTPWWVVPSVWLPPVFYGSWVAYNSFETVWELPVYWLTGLAVWTIVEYGLHRFLFHLDE